MDARTKEAIRYLGYGRHAVDDHTLKLVESCFEELSCWVQRLDRKLICYCGNIPSEIWQEW